MEPIMQITAKFSFYTTIHKAIRKEIFALCVLAGQTDFYDTNLSESFEEKLKGLFTLLREHSRHEEIFIHPLLLEKNLVEFESINKDHQELEDDLDNLEKLFAHLIEADNKASCLEDANNFYLELCQFASHYLAHLYFEEKHIMETLINNYDLSELQTAMDRFKKAQSLEDALATLTLMFASINSAESLFMLTTMQQSVPHELFNKVCQLAKSTMPKDNWGKIETQLIYT
jgi:hypothetical protein